MSIAQEYEFHTKDYKGEPIEVVISIHSWFIYIGHHKFTTYGTLTVIDTNNKYTYYHDAVVWNGKDRFDEKLGEFLVLSKLLRQRWMEQIADVDFPASKVTEWNTYKRHWGAFYWRLRNGDVNDNSDLL